MFSLKNLTVKMLALYLLFLSSSVFAMEIEGVQIHDSVTLSDGSQLVLNGAGIREKFFFDIYIGALYLTAKQKAAADILQDSGRKRVVMHFLYDEVTAEKIVTGWQEGFEDNLTKQQLSAVASRLEKFNRFFTNMKKGDAILLDFLPDAGTQVTINGKIKGSIAGQDFNNALLKVWLGEKPADKKLKKAMLGG